MHLDDETVRAATLALGTGAQSVLPLLSMELRPVASLIDKATTLMGIKKYEEAQALLTDLADLNPSSPWLAYLVGECCLARGKPEEAARSFERALARAEARVPAAPRVAQLVRLGRARALALAGRHVLARADLEAAAVGSDTGLAAFARSALGALDPQRKDSDATELSAQTTGPQSPAKRRGRGGTPKAEPGRR